MAELTQEDREIRHAAIGSSEIAAIAGENPWANAHDVWLKKKGFVEDESSGSDATWLGHELEPIIARRWEREMGIALVPGGKTRRHPEHTWCVGTLDYQTEDASRIVECKYVGGRVANHWLMDADGAPPYYQIQVQWQMGLSGIHCADVAVIFGATAEFRIYRHAFDPGVFEALLGIGERFMRLLDSDAYPAIDGSESARETLRAVYGSNRRPLAMAPPDAQVWFSRRLEADREIDRWESEKKLATNKLCEMVGDADGIEGEFGKFTWKARKDGVRVAKLYPRKDK